MSFETVLQFTNHSLFLLVVDEYPVSSLSFWSPNVMSQSRFATRIETPRTRLWPGYKACDDTAPASADAIVPYFWTTPVPLIVVEELEPVNATGPG